ncbi:mis18-binding protein 1 isoform X2 [Dendropsophus ebraccatus]|uniref:mis18-binding protein 1 isoform X2 n=1 Tax=Dendropsophus ebraccatus TaxID=150705 RepID=UPI0038322898
MFLKTNPSGSSDSRHLQSIPVEFISPDNLTPVKNLKMMIRPRGYHYQSTLIRDGAEPLNFPNFSIIQSHQGNMASRMMMAGGPMSSSASTSSTDSSVLRVPRRFLQALPPVHLPDRLVNSAILMKNSEDGAYNPAPESNHIMKGISESRKTTYNVLPNRDAGSSSSGSEDDDLLFEEINEGKATEDNSQPPNTKTNFVDHFKELCQFMNDTKLLNVPSEQAPLFPAAPLSPPADDQPIEENKIFLTEWLVKGVEHRGICVEGKRLDMDDTFWHSNIIEQRIQCDKLKTVSGRVYELIGTADTRTMTEVGYPSWLTKKFLEGFPEDWKSYIRYFCELSDRNGARTVKSVQTAQPQDIRNRTKDEGTSRNQAAVVSDTDSDRGPPKKVERRKPERGTGNEPKPTYSQHTHVTKVREERISSDSTQISETSCVSTTSRSGRQIKPVLKFWCGERLSVDIRMSTTIVKTGNDMLTQTKETVTRQKSSRTSKSSNASTPPKNPSPDKRAPVVSHQLNVLNKTFETTDVRHLGLNKAKGKNIKSLVKSAQVMLTPMHTRQDLKSKCLQNKLHYNDLTETSVESITFDCEPDTEKREDRVPSGKDTLSDESNDGDFIAEKTFSIERPQVVLTPMHTKQDLKSKCLQNEVHYHDLTETSTETSVFTAKLNTEKGKSRIPKKTCTDSDESDNENVITSFSFINEKTFVLERKVLETTSSDSQTNSKKAKPLISASHKGQRSHSTQCQKALSASSDSDESDEGVGKNYKERTRNQKRSHLPAASKRQFSRRSQVPSDSEEAHNSNEEHVIRKDTKKLNSKGSKLTVSNKSDCAESQDSERENLSRKNSEKMQRSTLNKRTHPERDSEREESSEKELCIMTSPKNSQSELSESQHSEDDIVLRRVASATMGENVLKHSPGRRKQPPRVSKRIVDVKESDGAKEKPDKRRKSKELDDSWKDSTVCISSLGRRNQPPRSKRPQKIVESSDLEDEPYLSNDNRRPMHSHKTKNSPSSIEDYVDSEEELVPRKNLAQQPNPLKKQEPPVRLMQKQRDLVESQDSEEEEPRLRKNSRHKQKQGRLIKSQGPEEEQRSKKDSTTAPHSQKKPKPPSQVALAPIVLVESQDSEEEEPILRINSRRAANTQKKKMQIRSEESQDSEKDTRSREDSTTAANSQIKPKTPSQWAQKQTGPMKSQDSEEEPRLRKSTKTAGNTNNKQKPPSQPAQKQPGSVESQDSEEEEPILRINSRRAANTQKKKMQIRSEESQDSEKDTRSRDGFTTAANGQIKPKPPSHWAQKQTGPVKSQDSEEEEPRLRESTKTASNNKNKQKPPSQPAQKQAGSVESHDSEEVEPRLRENNRLEANIQHKQKQVSLIESQDPEEEPRSKKDSTTSPHSQKKPKPPSQPPQKQFVLVESQDSEEESIIRIGSRRASNTHKKLMQIGSAGPQGSEEEQRSRADSTTAANSQIKPKSPSQTAKKQTGLEESKNSEEEPILRINSRRAANTKNKKKTPPHMAQKQTRSVESEDSERELWSKKNSRPAAKKQKTPSHPAQKQIGSVESEDSEWEPILKKNSRPAAKKQKTPSHLAQKQIGSVESEDSEWEPILKKNSRPAAKKQKTPSHPAQKQIGSVESEDSEWEPILKKNSRPAAKKEKTPSHPAQKQIGSVESQDSEDNVLSRKVSSHRVSKQKKKALSKPAPKGRPPSRSAKPKTGLTGSTDVEREASSGKDSRQTSGGKKQAPSDATMSRRKGVSSPDQELQTNNKGEDNMGNTTSPQNKSSLTKTKKQTLFTTDFDSDPSPEEDDEDDSWRQLSVHRAPKRAIVATPGPARRHFHSATSREGLAKSGQKSERPQGKSTSPQKKQREIRPNAESEGSDEETNQYKTPADKRKAKAGNKENGSVNKAESQGERRQHPQKIGSAGRSSERRVPLDPFTAMNLEEEWTEKEVQRLYK